MAYPDGRWYKYRYKYKIILLPGLRPYPVRGHQHSHDVFHQSCPCCEVHPHFYCQINYLLMIAVWHLWHEPLLCLGKQRGCRAYSSREHRCFRQEGMADCGLYHGSIHCHTHSAHLAHAAPSQGMHPTSHTCPFVSQPAAICILLTLLMLRRLKVCIQAHIPVPLSSSHLHPAHLAHAASAKGMRPSSHTCPFV